jgi:hypothetical protein
MAGYKTAVIDDDAASLWSFDGDAFDPTTRLLLVPTGNPLVIIDEIDNLNPAFLTNDNQEFPGYRLGTPSLVNLEQTDQYSICFGYYGKQVGHPNEWGKAWLTVPNSITYSFPRFGSFSVELLFQKQSGVKPNCSTWTSPIISKSGVFSVSYVATTSTGGLVVGHPGGTVSLGSTIISSASITSRVVHFVLVWDVREAPGNSFVGTVTIYANGHIWYTNSYVYQDTFPTTNVNSSIQIGGSGGTLCSSNTEPLYIDQVAIYDRPLTSFEVARHTAKVWGYDDLIRNHFVSRYWTFADLDSPTSTTISANVGSLAGAYQGGRNFGYFRQQLGPPKLFGSQSVYFTNGGMAAFISTTSGSYNAQAINSDYTYEFWFNVTSVERSVLLAATQLSHPFSGLLVQLNVRDRVPMVGSLCFSESHTDTVCNSLFLNDNGNRLYYNDGQWHHIVIRRQSDQISLWLDGRKHSQVTNTSKSVGQPGQITLMNASPGMLGASGNISKFSHYTFALQDHLIQNHYSYTTIYRIRGVVTLLGVAYQATLRFYLSASGEFLFEMQSDPQTGEYYAEFPNNAHIDILVFSPGDLSVRYRAYGPVTPAEFDDYPINL